MMQIIVNGKRREAREEISVLGLLEELKLNPQTIVIELNGAVLERAHFGEKKISDGDRFELVRLVGGG